MFLDKVDEDFYGEKEGEGLSFKLLLIQDNTCH